MRKTIITIAGLALGLTAVATAQTKLEPRQVIRQAPMPDIRAEALDTETDITGAMSSNSQRRAAVRIDKKDPNLNLNFTNVNAFHERMRCGRGETKRLIIGGVQDNFAQPQDPYLSGHSTAPWPNTNGYDGGRANRHFWDQFQVPSAISKGYMLTGLRSLDGLITTDSLGVGNRAAAIAAPGSSNDPWFSSTPANMPTSGFQVSGNVTGAGANYLASLSNMQMGNGQNVLQFIQGNGTNPVDVFFQDDTSVDYVAFSVCEKPKKMGMTWGIAPTHPEPVTGSAAVSCTDKDGTKCDPYQGDTLCSTELPILCIRKDNTAFPKPASVSNSSQYLRWAFGIIGTTKPMAAPDKLSVANAACETEFGKGWRVAQHHDGWGWGLQAHGNVGTLSKRFWTDIRDQPNGVCWDRSQ